MYLVIYYNLSLIHYRLGTSSISGTLCNCGATSVLRIMLLHHTCIMAFMMAYFETWTRTKRKTGLDKKPGRAPERNPDSLSDPDSKQGFWLCKIANIDHFDKYTVCCYIFWGKIAFRSIREGFTHMYPDPHTPIREGFTH